MPQDVLLIIWTSCGIFCTFSNSDHARKICKSADPHLTAQTGTLTLLGTYAVDFSFASKKR